MMIWCCACNADVDARLTNGAEIYPHRPDLRKLPFWRCDTCDGYVGCHHKTTDRTRPLGVIPTAELRTARNQIHRMIDPLWRNNKITRKRLYKRISDELGYSFHSARMKSMSEVESVLNIGARIRDELTA